jgi:DNA-binding NtrC family response regulator
MILVVEDTDPELYVRHIQFLQRRIVGEADALPVEYATTFEEAEAYFSPERIRSGTYPRLVVLDMTFPRGPLPEDELAGYSLIQKYAPQCPDTEWIAMTGIVEWHETEVEPGISLFDALYYRYHLLDVYEKTGDLSRLESSLRRFFLPKTPPKEDYFELALNGESIVTRSFNLWHKLTMVARDEKRGVLIFGENGTGKELFAKAMHVLSVRKSKPFGQMDGTSAFFEAEFFGDVASSPSGSRPQMLEGGTLYISNIDRVSLQLQEHVMRDCATHDVRLIGGIDTPRKQFSKKEAIYRGILGHFVPFDVPSLEERSQDIPALVEYFVRRFNQVHGTRKDLRGRDQIYSLLGPVAWPDNVAGLKSVVEQVLRETMSDQITAMDFERVLESAIPEPRPSISEEVAAAREKKPARHPIIITDEDLRRYGLR